MIFKYKPGAKAGDRRTNIRFAWIPKQLSNGDYIWLERYLLTESLQLTRLPGSSVATYLDWVEVESILVRHD